MCAESDRVRETEEEEERENQSTAMMFFVLIVYTDIDANPNIDKVNRSVSTARGATFNDLFQGPWFAWCTGFLVGFINIDSSK